MATYPTYANMIGMIAIFVKIVMASLLNEKYWDVYLVHQEVKAMKWHNGCLKVTNEWFPVEQLAR